MVTQRERSSVRWIALALVVLPVLAIFAPVLLQDRSFAFRDTAVFYYPLFEWIEQQWQRGELPLWNPHVNYGTPVIGEASSSVFYPGKAIFLLPLEFSWKFKLYVVGHVFLAAAGMYLAARRFGSSTEAAALAAISYACGGGVLFQYCNLVFLVGAAWLPWAIAAVEAMLTEFSLRTALVLGVVLALMVLGGDPQMAYHAGLAATGYAIGLCVFERVRLRPSRDLQSPNIDDNVRLGRSLALPGPATLMGLLAVAALSAFMLAAIQSLPAAEVTSLSDRAVYGTPRNIYEAAQVIATNDDGLTLAASGLFGEPEPETHSASIYQFSFAPWQVAEYVWPNFSGRYFPQYRRWQNAWPGEPRMWNQSVYLGLLPLLLGVASLRLRSGTIRERWLSWCVALAVLGSFGEFGLGSILRQLLYLLGYANLANELPANPVGGVYWFFVSFLPGYAYFRFPAKLLTFAACPCCLLAAQGFDRLCSVQNGRTPRLQWVLLVVALLSGALALATLLSESWFVKLAGAIAPDEAYGPFNAAGARHDLLLSFVHTLVVAGLTFLILNRRHLLQRVTLSLLAITAAEIVVANAPLIGTAPSDLWREHPLLAKVLEHDRLECGGNSVRLTVRRTVEHETELGPWQATSSPHRLEELAAADRHLLETNHCLAGSIDSVECLTSQRLADYTYFHQRYQQSDESYWGNYRIMPETSASNDSVGGRSPWQPLDYAGFSELTKYRAFRHERPFPRVWIVHEVTVLPELKSRDPDTLTRRGAEVLEKIVNGEVERRDLRREAVVETDQEVVLPHSDSVSSANEICRLVREESHRVVLDVELQSAGLLVLGDVWFPGWIAYAESSEDAFEEPKPRRPLPILRTNRMFRGVLLVPGRQRVTFEYVPIRLYMGAIISSIGWIVLTVGGLVRLRKPVFVTRKASPSI